MRAIVFVGRDGDDDGKNKKGETVWWGCVAHLVTGGGTYILECAFAQLEALIVSFLGRVGYKRFRGRLLVCRGYRGKLILSFV